MEIRMKIKKRISNSLLYGILIVSSMSCTAPGDIYHVSHDMGKGWARFNTLTWEYEKLDSMSIYDFYMDIRHEMSYKYKNLAFEVDITTPDSTYTRMISIDLADDTGRWYGDSWGSLVQIERPVKEYVTFKKTGGFMMTARPGMTVNDIEGINSIGLKIKKR